MYFKRARTQEVWLDYQPRSGGYSQPPPPEPQEDEDPIPPGDGNFITEYQINPMVMNNNLLRGIPSTTWWYPDEVTDPSTFQHIRLTNGVEIEPNRYIDNLEDRILTFNLPYPTDVNSVKAFYSRLALDQERILFPLLPIEEIYPRGRPFWRFYDQFGQLILQKAPAAARDGQRASDFNSFVTEYEDLGLFGVKTIKYVIPKSRTLIHNMGLVELEAYPLAPPLQWTRITGGTFVYESNLASNAIWTDSPPGSIVRYSTYTVPSYYTANNRGSWVLLNTGVTLTDKVGNSLNPYGGSFAGCCVFPTPVNINKIQFTCNRGSTGSATIQGTIKLYDENAVLKQTLPYVSYIGVTPGLYKYSYGLPSPDLYFAMGIKYVELSVGFNFGRLINFSVF